ncbi:MAG: type IV secretion system DNA-binding domain-containing protein [Phycisphaeraceae bacterium]|nr:type IV secretion system DNA-binding domain-containing protein [Phycisphaeraceae bacterium]
MEHPPNLGSDGQHQQAQDDWKQILFPHKVELASPQFVRVPCGPYGNARLATSADLLSLMKDASAQPERYVRLLDAYAVAHDPAPTVFSLPEFPIPLGCVAPNLLTVGRSGSGKTMKVTLPAARYAIAAGLALIYINVMGKMQTRLISRIAKQCRRDHEVHVLAPSKPSRSIGWTALDGCSDLKVAGEVAACLVSSAAGNSRYGEGAWCYNQAQEWLQHALAAICSDLPPERQTLIELRRVVLGGDFKAFADAHPRFPVLRKFARYEQGGNKNAETIASSIAEATAFIDDIAAVLAQDELSITEFAQHGGIIILEVDEYEVERLSGFTTLFLGRLISKLQRVACESPNGKLCHRTVICIDELAAAAQVPGLASALHTGRQRAIHFVGGVQSIAQLASIYGSKAKVVLEGFQSQVALGGGLDGVSADYFSKKSGMTTIAVPSVFEHGDDEGGGIATSGRSWQLAARSLLLACDVASPEMHPMFGAPATVFLGDGTTPPFQVYLTPFYELGHLAKLLEEVSQVAVDDDLRSEPLRAPEMPTLTDAPAEKSFTDVRGWTDDQILFKLNEVKRSIGFDKLSKNSPARRWWESLERENTTRTALVLRLAEELANRNPKASIKELYIANLNAHSESFEAILCYMDYSRLKRKAAKNYESNNEEADPNGIDHG